MGTYNTITDACDMCHRLLWLHVRWTNFGQRGLPSPSGTGPKQTLPATHAPVRLRSGTPVSALLLLEKDPEVSMASRGGKVRDNLCPLLCLQRDRVCAAALYFELRCHVTEL